MTVEGDLISRVELFDEADIDAALVRFEELHRQAPRLENAATQVEQRSLTYFAARDWDAMAESLADDISTDDRRHVVNAGVRRGRKAEIASMRAVADVGVTNITSTVIAIRGGRLALGCYSVLDGWSGSKVLSVFEINTENQIVARVTFDIDDVDAAFAELDARYLAGEAAAHRTRGRSSQVPTQPSTDTNSPKGHRSMSTPASDDVRLERPDHNHPRHLGPHTGPQHPHRGCASAERFGAVVTHTAYGTSLEGFEAEWRMIQSFDGRRRPRHALRAFDEADVDAAIAKFEQLSRPAPRLENAASRTYERYGRYFAAREWAAIAELLTADTLRHRSPTGRELRGPARSRRRNREHASRRLPSGPKPLRRPSLRRGAIALRSAVRVILGPRSDLEAFRIEFCSIVEIDADERILARVAFDPDDIDGAFEELDARYVAGEAADHAHTWSVIARECAAFNRRELPRRTGSPSTTGRYHNDRPE